jgi:hypothetical protein
MSIARAAGPKRLFLLKLLSPEIHVPHWHGDGRSNIRVHKWRLTIHLMPTSKKGDIGTRASPVAGR